MCLRGIRHWCPHRVSAPGARVLGDSNPDFPGMKQAVTVAFSWRQVESWVLYRYPAASRTFEYLWRYWRSAIFVSIQGGRLDTVRPPLTTANDRYCTNAR
jgi:hypothetical protein